MRIVSKLILSSLIILLAGCNLFTISPTGQIATPSSGTPAPAAQLRISVRAPSNTPDNADLTLVLLDPATNLDINAQRIPMEAQGDGTWTLSLTPTVGSLLYYRYEVSGAIEGIEVTIQGAPVDFRTIYVPGPGEIRDIVARWSGEPYSGESGRILGRIVSSENGQPLNEMLVSAGGHLTFTDGEGRFRLDDLPPGLHTITAFSPTGSFLPARQDAQIAANTTTPVELGLHSAEPVVVTFQVTVPADTPEQATLRLAGEVAQLGFRFKPSEFGSYQSVARMPALIRVDPEHFLGVFSLYSGLTLHYKYTLGDGVWNAERSGNGAFVTRSATLEGENITLRDQIESWSGGSGTPTRFEIAAPEGTPARDEVAIQFKAGTWKSPLPMWLQEGIWTYTLFGSESFQQGLEYRYCRNELCGYADEAGFAGRDASGRPLNASQIGKLNQEVIEAWQWLDRSALQGQYPSEPQPLDFLTTGGVELSKAYDPNWLKQLPIAFTSVQETGANEVIITPAWTWVQQNPFPVLELDPNTAPLETELQEMSKLGRDHGLRVSLHPSFSTGKLDNDTWWQQGIRNQLWWEMWFEEYRSLVVTYANLAQQIGAEKLIIGGPEVLPALPFGQLADGSLSGAPADSEARWRELVTDVRERFAGQLAFELEVYDGISQVPPFMDLFDQVHIFWHSPLDEGESGELQQAEIEAQIIRVLEQNALFDKPISISLAYLSLENSAAACPQRPDGSCRPLSDFSRGQVVDIDLEVDMQAQARIYETFLRAIPDETRIDALYARGFYPAAILHDKSLSVYGKPAQDVLAAWFEGLTK